MTYYSLFDHQTRLAQAQVKASNEIWLALVVQAGGKVQRRRISDLSELADFDIVINCMGLGAKTLFHDDKLFPVRYDSPSGCGCP